MSGIEMMMECVDTALQEQRERLDLTEEENTRIRNVIRRLVSGFATEMDGVEEPEEAEGVFRLIGLTGMSIAAAVEGMVWYMTRFGDPEKVDHNTHVMLNGISESLSGVARRIKEEEAA